MAPWQIVSWWLPDTPTPPPDDTGVWRYEGVHDQAHRECLNTGTAAINPMIRRSGVKEGGEEISRKALRGYVVLGKKTLSNYGHCRPPV